MSTNRGTSSKDLGHRSGQANQVRIAPHAIVRGPDDRSRWVALCPSCAERDREAVVSGSEDETRAACATCGATVEVRPSGIYRVSPTLPPPEE